MDLIYLKEIKVETIIGIYPWERQVKQPVVINLEMATDIRKAAATDRIEDTLNYKEISKRILEFVSHSEFQLIETLTERIAEIILTEFNVPWVQVQLSKPGAIRGARDVGVRIERSQSGDK